MLIISAKDKTTKDISIHTLGITPSETTFYLHCHMCGQQRGLVQGRLTRLVSWHEPALQASFIDKCLGWCGQLVVFQNTPPAKRVLVRVTKETRAAFRCPICSRRMMLDEEDCPRCNTMFDFRITDD